MKTIKTLLKQAFNIIAPSYLLTLTLGAGLILTTTSKPAHASGVVGTGTPGSCTEVVLNNVLVGGGNVTFNCGSSPVTITVSREKVILANTLIDGGNLITLSGGGITRIFSTNSAIQFTVKNLTIANGFTNNEGGGIFNGRGILTVSNCKFNNNISNQPGEHGGGAILSYPTGKVIVDRSTFTGNKASLGGAIRILNSDLTVTNSTFIGNSAVDRNIGNGGAIYIDGANGDNGKIILRNSTFTNNSATSYGGAFFNNIYNNNQTIVDSSTFSGNRVGGGSNGQGGAIWSTGDPAGPGGIWLNPVNNTTLTVTNTTITGNTASQQGGGIWLARHPVGINITNTTLFNNTATNSNGGAIALGGDGRLNITNSTISGNRVAGAFSLGGGMMIASGQANITNSTIAGNYAAFQGGGIVGGRRITLANTIIANNRADNGGNNWNIKHNCFDQMNDGGNNIQFPAKNPGDYDCTAGIRTANPLLGPLGSNGGLTQTMQLLTGSPAINTGNNATCPATDQRGVSRPRGVACDIGAFES